MWGRPGAVIVGAPFIIAHGPTHVLGLVGDTEATTQHMVKAQSQTPSPVGTQRATPPEIINRAGQVNFGVGNT
jgi:hypothetical protein